MTLPLGRWTAALWRGATSTNTRCVLSIGALFAGLLAAGVYRSFEPMQHAEVTPAAVNGDPVARFHETRVGQVLYSPSVGSNNCRRILFNNQNGAFYDAGDVSCIRLADEISPAAGARPVQGVDRMQAMRDHFQK